MARHHDRGWEGAPGRQGMQHLKAPCAGHLVIDHQHIIGPRRIQGQPGGTIASHRHSVAGPLQGALCQSRLPGVVFHDQNTYRPT